jgi:hypothetical protein
MAARRTGRFSSSLISSELRRGRHWQVFFGGSRRERNRSLHMFSFQGGKVGEDFFAGVSGSQACQHRAKSNPGAPENRLPAANLRVSYDFVFVVHRRRSLPSPSGPSNEHHTIGANSARGARSQGLTPQVCHPEPGGTPGEEPALRVNLRHGFGRAFLAFLALLNLTVRQGRIRLKFADAVPYHQVSGKRRSVTKAPSNPRGFCFPRLCFTVASPWSAEALSRKK